MTINLSYSYVVRPDADGAKPMSDMEFVVVDLRSQKVIHRCVTQREANEICNYMNQLRGGSDGLPEV